MKRVDWPLLLMALAATAAIGYFTGNQVYADRCGAIGGRVMHFGGDRPCVLPDRSTVRIDVLPVSPEGRAALAVTLAAGAGVIYLGLLRVVRPTRKPGT